MTLLNETPTSWEQALASEVPNELANEISAYETTLELRRQDKVDEKLFAETRLRRGVYGQRYDNGQRNDGTSTRTLEYPSGSLTKGPHTVWDAPGMMRIKIPFGAMDATQLGVLADLSEEYSDAISHITTRQDIQFHFIHIDDTPDIMRRLAAVGITTREACGNSVRNVTACPLSGVCTDEAFDVSPYAHALTYYLLGHKDAQDFGRKVKIAFSGCAQHACGLANMHDMGLVARTRVIDGTLRRGFEFYVGGGLGAVPHQAKLLGDFVEEDQLLPTAQAICRIFARLGEKRNRARARLKFLVAKLGIEEFRTMVADELREIPDDERWTAYLDHLEVADDGPTREGAALALRDTAARELDAEQSARFLEWAETNVAAQRQDGYSVVTVALPLGDFTAKQGRDLARITRTYNGGLLRATVEQNFVLRHISNADLAQLWLELDVADLALAGAGTLVDLTSCPGTDTCKLGISSSRGLASELRRRVQTGNYLRDAAVQNLKIKVSGCFNSCGQHHVADIGFYGVSRKHEGRTVPHFQVVVGGQWQENAGSYGLAIVAVPSKRIPLVVDRLTRSFVEQRVGNESFQDFTRRIGKARLRELLQDLTLLPSYAAEPEVFSDWRDPREYTIGDLGIGECAGEVVPVVQFGLQASERQVFEAQIELEEGSPGHATQLAYRAMLQAAKALTRVENIDVPDDPATIVSEFKTRFYDTERFFDPFAGGKFAHYLFALHEQSGANEGSDGKGEGVQSAIADTTQESAHRTIEEAQLFIEAAHACYNRMSDAPSV